MTTTTDLSPERLDELAQWIEQPGHHPTRAESRVLIAMARAKQAAERERDEWRAFAQRTEIWDAGGCCACCGEEEGHTGSCLWRIAALAQPTTEGGE